MRWRIETMPRHLQVFVRLYDNRLEIQSRGGLLPGLTLEQVLADGELRRRNPVIAEVLRQMGKMTTVGRGLALICQGMTSLGSPAPEFASDGQHFRGHNAVTPREVAVTHFEAGRYQEW